MRPLPLTLAPALVCLLAVLSGGCSPDPSKPRGEPAALPSPVGPDAYREILRTEAGVDLDPRELAALAEADEAWISDRMDRLVGRLASEPVAGGWHTAFEPLRDDHPPDAEAVLAAYRAEVEKARAFVLEHGLITIPPGREDRLEVVRTPASIPPGLYTFVGYIGYRLAVTVGEGERLRDHCRVCIPPLAVHETYPGHHVAFLHQRSGSAIDDPKAAARAYEHLTNPFFHEGWGQYAEVLMMERGYYDGAPERELGAWRSLLFRTVRAKVDPLLQTGEMGPADAALALEPFLDPETAREEVARHLADPGSKAAYYVGLLQVLELRDAVAAVDAGDAGDADQPGFDLQAFHDRLTRLPGPIPRLARERFGVELPPGLVPLSRRPDILALGADPVSSGSDAHPNDTPRPLE